MLSISKPIRSAGQGEYYLNLAATDDYYLESEGEPPGYWIGEGCQALGLSGLLQKADFRNLLRGLSPKTSEKLVYNAYSNSRRAGWDLTWSPPKSVSVAWSQASPDVRRVIESCVRHSVQVGINYLQSVGVVSRRGENGIFRETAKLILAAFEHSTSRAQDPQLHVHTILMNVGVRPNGSTGTLDPKNLFRHQMAAGALFRAELAALLETRLGLRSRRDGRAFELSGVSAALMAFFSKRRLEIEALLLERGLSGGKAGEIAALDSRSAKQNMSRAELFKMWHEAGLVHHWSAKDLAWLLKAQYPKRDREREIALAANLALAAATTQNSTFSERQLLQYVAQECQGRGLAAKDAFQITQGLFQCSEVVPLSPFKGELHWTTREVLAMEQSILDAAASLRGREMAQVMPFPESVGSHLSAEQQQALKHVCESSGSLRLIQGFAGTGKSTLFAVAREIWESQGLHIFGAAPSGKAAQGIQESTGIQSSTIHSLLYQIEKNAVTLTDKSVILVDEAAMVGTRELVRVFSAVLRSGGSLVLCGDSRQLQAVQLGGVFAELARRHCSVELTEIRRQREEWTRSAIKDFAYGDAEKALSAYKIRGLVREEESSIAGINRLVAEWKVSDVSEPTKTLILAGTIEDVTTLNRKAQEERKKAGFLSAPGVQVRNEMILVGDRVLFTQNSRSLGVFNGDTGTVRRVSDGTLSVELDTKAVVEVDCRVYDRLRLG